MRAALVALLAGPTDEEAARGYRGVPFEDPEGLVRDVTVRPDGTAVVDYTKRLTAGLAQGHTPTARLSAGFTRTALAVDGVTGVRHTTGDTCAFGGPRDGPCPVRTRDGAETGRP